MTIRERVERIEKECSGVWAQSGVTAWERTFLTSVKSRPELSVRQAETLTAIENKVFNKGGDDAAATDTD